MRDDVTDLHRQAMQFADEAEAATRSGDAVGARTYFRRAFDLERQAAEAIVAAGGREPSRSVLLRSAASLAICCHEYREAERLIATALAGDPPAEICEELRDLLEGLYADSSLRSRS